MEEHLKNTEKLDEEWAALCSYEPDPCSTAIAEAEGNSECNRTDAALPYDHSRVVLNDLANPNNSDYINASTIVSFINSCIVTRRLEFLFLNFVV